MSIGVPEEGASTGRLAILLAMAMSVLVVDTSLMNVSISAVVEDLDTTVRMRLPDPAPSSAVEGLALG